MPNSPFDYPIAPDKTCIWVEQKIECAMVELAQEKVDAIHLAAEIGRLDIVSLILMFFGLLLAILAFFGFWSIKSAALEAAREAARAEVNRIAPEMFGEADKLTTGKEQKATIDFSKFNEDDIINRAKEVEDE